MLEGSRRESGGRKVQLDLTEVSTYSLFPGQIVLVEGINSSGRRMVAKRIVEGVPPRVPMTAPAKLLDYHHSTLYQGGKPLSVVVAAGPFTTADNLDYEPFEDLLGRVFQSKPDVLILTGPFVDVTQPLLASGDVTLQSEDVPAHDASYEMVFVEKIIRDGIGALFNTAEERGVTLPTNIILVPSLSDGHHEMVFPQPPFGDRDRVESKFFEEPLGVLNIPFSKDDDIRKRVHLMPNPCMFRYTRYIHYATCFPLLLEYMTVISPVI
jgi:DNA polymerase alpha subunit B